MAATDDTTGPRSTPNRDRQHTMRAKDVSAETSEASPLRNPAIEAERRKLMQVHSLLHCLSEVLLHADGEDAILYAQVVQLGAELLDDSVARLEQAA